MIFDNAKQIINKLAEVSIDVISESLIDISKEEFEKIPIIDAHTKIVAEKYAICFTHSFRYDWGEYYQMYLISTCLFREDKAVNVKN